MRMRSLGITAALAALLLGSTGAQARDEGKHESKHASSTAASKHSNHMKGNGTHSAGGDAQVSSRGNGGQRGPMPAPGVKRDPDGTIHRSAKAKDDFRKSHPCPSTGKSTGACPGYVIDHVEPLKRGGADAPSNMQWQTKSQAKNKDKTD
jgi:hypothetical protein